MIVLDTNILSELTRIAPSTKVFGWMALQPSSSIFTTAITQAELLYGIELMPKGRRRSALQAAVKEMLSQEFADRILPFDSDAAEAFAVIYASRRAMAAFRCALACPLRAAASHDSGGSAYGPTIRSTTPVRK